MILKRKDWERITLLTINTLISWKTDDDNKKVERILWIEPQSNITYVIDVNLNAFPYSRLLSDIEESIKQGIAFIETDDAFGRIINEEDISEKDKEARDKAWEIISEIVCLEPLIFIPKERRNLIKKVSTLHNVHENTVVKYLKKYWKRGKTKNALLPDYYQCGGKGKEKSAGILKRGRPRKNTEIFGEGINVDDDIKRVFRIAVNKYYHTSAQNSLMLTYELMRKEFFSSEVKMENGIEIPIVKPSSEVPSYAQFKYWFEKERNLKKEISLRRSAKKYEQENRPIMGSSTAEALGPGSIYQIDATVADVYLVSQFNRNWIIGRPVVYGVIDVFSRLVTGIYIGLEGPSWVGAMMALANAAMDKVEFCKNYGIEISAEEWPACHLPDAILADRGELEGKNAENLINALGIKIMNTPPYRADWKGIIEQNFKTTSDRVKPFMPGVVNPDLRERGDKDYRLDAKLNLYEFTQIMIKSVLYHNNQHLLRNYNREEMMIEDDVKCIPLELWNWGIANRSGKLRSADADIVKLCLMPTATATVTGKGIKFKNLYYSSKMTLKENWFEKARNKGSWKIKISYDPRNMKYIYIISPDHSDFEKCYMLDYQKSYFDKYYEEIEYLQEKEKLDMKKMADDELQKKVDLMAEIESIVAKADLEAKKERIFQESDSKRVQGIRRNRRIEKALNRDSEVFELSKETDKKNGEVIHIDSDMELLIRKQKEALKKIYE